MVKNLKNLKNHSFPYLLIIPSFLLLLFTVIYPLGFSLYNSFQRWNLQTSAVPLGYVGFDNYLNVLRDPTFLKSLANTFKLSIVATAFEFIVGLGIALLLNTDPKGASIIRSLLIMPTTIAPIVVGLLFRFLYYKDGLITYLLSSVGFSIPEEGLLGCPSTALWAVAATDIWQWTPFFTIILLAGLQSIPEDIIEAAQIDGASFFNVFWHIILPHLTPVASIIITIRFMTTFNLFDIVYAETMGGPGVSTRTLSYNLYYEGLVYFNIGSACALAWIMIVIVTVILNLFTNFAFRREEW